MNKDIGLFCEFNFYSSQELSNSLQPHRTMIQFPCILIRGTFPTQIPNTQEIKKGTNDQLIY